MIRLALLAALLLPAALAGGPEARAEEWIDHRPGGMGYRVAFPAQPIENGQDVNTAVGAVKMRISAVEIGGRMFVTIDSVYPSNFKMGDPQTNLDVARDGGLRNVNGKLVSEERLTIDKAPARRLVIDIPHSQQTAEALLVLDGHRLHQAVYVGARGAHGAEEASRFLSSFALER